MTDNGGATPPAGWYQDPRDGGMLRYWDGARWTEHTSVMPARPPDPRISVGEEHSIARWARHAVVGYAFLSVIAGALSFRMMTGFRNVFGELMANPQAPPPGGFGDPTFGMSPGAFGVLQLVNVVQLALLIVLLIWIYRAATAAAQLGIPARRGPGWAVGSWFIPVLNLWWPYQSLQDLLPDDHPMRRRLLLLWLAWVIGGLLALTGLGLWMFGVDAGLYVGALGYLCSASAALAGRSVIDAVSAAHENLAGARDGI